jgi:MFS family permease
MNANATVASAAVPFSAALSTLYFVSLLSGLAAGIFNPLIAAHMARHGIGDVAIGASAALFFLCIAAAAPLASILIRRAGTRAVIATGLVVASASALLFPHTGNLVLWFVLRAAMGVGVGLYMIGGQSALNRYAREESRALSNGIHALAFGVGLGIGPVAGSALYEVTPALAFGAGALLLLAGIGPAWKVLTGRAPVASALDIALGRRLSLPLHGAFAYGFAEGTLMSLYPVFLLRHGYSIGEIGYAFSAFVVGGILSTLPLTHRADRIGIERMLGACTLVGMAATIGLVLSDSFALTFVSSLVAGGSFGPVFALSLALIGRTVRADELPAGAAWFTAMFSIGCASAPLIAALAMSQFGDRQIFTPALAVFALLALRPGLLGRRP